jgi:hypothetical protein
MGSIVVIFIIWALFASAVAYAFAYIEQRVNGLPRKRLKSALLLSILLGPLGWIILGMRSGLTYASAIREGVTRNRDEIRR